ncbi:MAG: CopG family transcriptional regulator [Cyanobacteriota bacterium]|nr:CopG family transcriptional regulator [Cyanobacteriota bacterium]
MFTYEQVLNQVYNLSTTDRLRLLEALQKMVNDGGKVVENDANNDYLQVQEWQVEHIQEGLRQGDAGEFASEEEVAAALARWRQ